MGVHIISSERSVEFIGIPIRLTTLTGAVNEFLTKTSRNLGQVQTYRLVNSYSLALADQDARYHALLSTQGVNFPDGKPLAIVLRALARRNFPHGQVRGPSFFAKCLDEGRSYGIRHFFLGGSPELLGSLTDRVSELFPGIQIAGTYSPPFRSLTHEEIHEQDRRIRSASPDVVWVGLGTPKQDFEAQRIRDEVGVATAGVGAAFDFVAGTKTEAPKWLRGLGLEWMFRLATEPRRLWRRYLFGNCRFLLLVAREVLRTR